MKDVGACVHGNEKDRVDFLQCMAKERMGAHRCGCVVMWPLPVSPRGKDHSGQDDHR